MVTLDNAPKNRYNKVLNAPVAQWIEHQSSELRVGGPNPSGRIPVLTGRCKHDTLTLHSMTCSVYLPPRAFSLNVQSTLRRKPMRLHDSIQDYFRFIQHVQGVAQGTQEIYKSWLRHFHRWLKANGYPDGVGGYSPVPSSCLFSCPALSNSLGGVSCPGLAARSSSACC